MKKKNIFLSKGFFHNLELPLVQKKRLKVLFLLNGKKILKDRKDSDKQIIKLVRSKGHLK